MTMVRYLLGTKEQRDTINFPFVLYHWTGLSDTVSCFTDRAEANKWINDVHKLCSLVAEVNQFADTPRHKGEFVEKIIPNTNLFCQRWGKARVPQDIRFSLLDGYSYFRIGDPPVFPPDIIWTEADSTTA